MINAEEVKSLGGEAANEANEAWLMFQVMYLMTMVSKVMELLFK